MTPTRPDPRDTDPLGVAEDIEPWEREIVRHLGKRLILITPRRPDDAYWRAMLDFAVKWVVPPPVRPSRLRRLIGWWRGG